MADIRCSINARRYRSRSDCEEEVSGRTRGGTAEGGAEIAKPGLQPNRFGPLLPCGGDFPSAKVCNSSCLPQLAVECVGHLEAKASSYLLSERHRSRLWSEIEGHLCYRAHHVAAQNVMEIYTAVQKDT